MGKEAIQSTNGAEMSVDFESEPGVPGHFRVVLVIGFLWNALAAFDYSVSKLHLLVFFTRLPGGLDADNAEKGLAMMPHWVGLLWGAGVWSMLAGSLMMMARTRHAAIAFAMGFAALVACNTGVLLHPNAGLYPGTGYCTMVGLGLFAVLGQWWYARSMFWRGVLR